MTNLEQQQIEQLEVSRRQQATRRMEQLKAIHASGKYQPNCVGLVVAGWIGCSVVTQVNNTVFIVNSNAPIILVFCQMLFGAVVHYSSTLAGNEGTTPDPDYARLQQNGIEELQLKDNKEPYTGDLEALGTTPPVPTLNNSASRKWMILAGICNATGHLLTMYSMLAIAPALTHVVRLLEPLLISAISYVILGNLPTTLQFLTVVPVIFGIYLIFESPDTISATEESSKQLIMGIVIAFGANLSMAIRNYSTEKFAVVSAMQGRNARRLDYPRLCLVGLPFMLLLLVLQLVIQPDHVVFQPTTPLSLATFFHVLYSSASFYVQSLTDPPSHSIIKFSSRTVIVLILAMVFGVHTNAKMIGGIICCWVGAWSYVFITTKGGRRKMLLVVLLLSTSIAARIYQAINMYQATSNVTQKIHKPTFGLSKLHNPSCVNIGWPAEPITWQDNSDRSHSAMVSVDSVIAVWTLPSPLTPVALDQIKVASSSRRANFTLLCGFQDCMDSTMMPNSHINLARLNIRETCRATPLETLVNQQNYHKLMAGTNWPSILQSLASLCVLYKNGGTMMNLLHTAPSDLPQTFWLPPSGAIHQGAALPSESRLVLEAMIAIFNSYPCYTSNAKALTKETWPIRFDLDVIVGEAVTAVVSTQKISSLPHMLNGSTPTASQWNSSLLTEWFGTLSMDTNVGAARGKSNFGDNTQSFAGLEFVPYLNTFVDRELMAPDTEFKGVSAVPSGEKTTLFVNAWYGRSKQQHWPPGPKLDPLMFALHLNNPNMKKIGTSSIAKAYYKSYGAIGARDTGTLEFLQSKGITSYLSACATLLLRNPFPLWLPRQDVILVVDVQKDALAKVLPPHLLASPKIVYLSQIRQGVKNRLDRFDQSYTLIMKYARAKLIVTSRIHTALPSVAFDTPVIFVKTEKLPGGGGNRTSGLLELFHTATVGKQNHVTGLEQFDFKNPPPNPQNHKRDRFRASFWNVIRQKERLKDAAQLYGLVPFPLFQDPNLPQSRVFHLFHNGSTAFDLHQRQTVESILHHHPNAKIILYSTTNSSVASMEPLIEVGYNVVIQPSVSLHDILASVLAMPSSCISDAVVAAFLETVDSSETHMDLQKLLVLYRDGGVYLDLDIILTKPMSELLKNALVSVDDSSNNSTMAVSDAMLVFDSHNHFLAKCINDYLARKGNVSDLASLLGRLAPQFISIRHQYDTHDVMVLPRLSLFPVPAEADLEQVLYEQDNTRKSTQAYTTMQVIAQESSVGVKLLNEDVPQLKETLSKKDSVAQVLYRDNCILCSDVL